MRDLSTGHGFVTPSDIDHRPWLWVCSLLALLYSLLCLGARFVGKWDLLWWDDLVLSIGYVFAVVHWGILFSALDSGLAVTALALTADQTGRASELYFAARIPLFLALCLSKLSILTFTRRIFAGDIYRENILFGVAYAITVLYGLLAILLSSAGCRPQSALVASVDAVCDANTARWTVLTALDGLTELIILAMPIWFISKNDLQASKKRIVIFVYAFRLLVIGISVAVTTTYFNFLNNGDDDIDIAPVVAWEEVLLAFSLISASFPCLRSFLWAFMSRGLMTMYGNTIAESSTNHSRSASVQLRSFNAYKSNTSRTGSETGDSRFRLRPEQVQYQVNVIGEPRRNPQPSGIDTRSRRSESDGSNQMVIHHQTSYRVENVSVV
ncbi:hypothetical protein CLAFUW4_02160 [Fulvia fulva]|uniref:Rhodopsin domain-containing protein n=1 Tax=Passalora fulva TaxID=5499 RepID=A0A9Q8L8U1_PASFU|nr:uncharacterized protein CLAFUR5_02151 [Fulvia fulva]KAK4635120.1 hypothetical protein CLAFUR4_02156 [Fulvia fulva]KAK4636896.1 hypothetical protein CLAFUR0_02159 [Fulvia fulva]UJO13056.1 hypothetical protein CLAFUR5_02151 [Fulvia fulva]WPV10008.1 hypothetical protein CLAFUW4_02160 [Fulvia fulva]WPV24720.1 hypothetical protein CLAFUW7_02160 [Fulvia fulva]